MTDDKFQLLESNGTSPYLNSQVSTQRSSRFVIGCGRSTADRVTRDVSDTCCRRQELPASESNHWYHYSPIDVTLRVPTPTISVSRVWEGVNSYISRSPNSKAYKLVKDFIYIHTYENTCICILVTPFECGTVVRNFSGVWRAQHHK
jgi:hypothetical protein